LGFPTHPEALSAPLAPGAAMRAEAGASISLGWQDLTYILPPPKKGEPGKVVLKDAFGRCGPGELAAILGPSGGGKTSLLNALAGRIPMADGAQLTGNVLLEAKGHTFHSAAIDLPAISAYVEQDDALFALSTVEETLNMIACLRLPAATPAERERRVDWVISTLGLSPVRHALIGSDKPGQRGISGGERKRVHLGLELLHMPRLIFVDEPTSGLDSFQAQNVMTTLRELACAGHTVVCSIHQPRSSIYQQIDKVILMSSGHTAYYGPGGAKCAAHFAQIGLPVPHDFNPADHYLDVISVDYRNKETEEASKQTVAKVVANCPAPSYEDMKIAPVGVVLPAELTAANKARVGFHVAFGILLRRTWRELTRDKAALGAKFGANAFFTLLFAWIYWRMDMTQTSLMNRTGICFFMAMNQAFGSVIGVSQAIPRQLKVVSRERAAKLYEVLPFYAATFICQLPLELLPQLICGSVIYTLTGLRPGWEHMFTYIGVLMLENFAGIGLGMVLSATFTEVEQAPQVAPMVVVLFLMFSGFFLNQDSIPKLLSPLKHISFVRFAFQALVVNELKGNDGFHCDGPRFGGPPCFQGDDWLKNLKFENVSIETNCGYLALEILIFNFLAFRILNARRPAFMKLKMTTVGSPAGKHVTNLMGA